jgi:hypothetical protein
MFEDQVIGLAELATVLDIARTCSFSFTLQEFCPYPDPRSGYHRRPPSPTNFSDYRLFNHRFRLLSHDSTLTGISNW